MELLKVENLTFTYPKQNPDAAEPEPTLQNVSFQVQEGAFVVVCGESGCGKTTLLKLLKRELAPAGERSGNIWFHGVEQAALTEREAACEIGFVLQNPENQTVTDKVWHELAFGLENMGVPTPVIRRRVAEMACFFGIDDWFRKKTTELSGGQKQLLNLAAVMVMQPKLLILDEPTSQLDPIAASDFINTLRKINKELGLTIIMTEHRLEDVLWRDVDRIVLMGDGKILADLHPDELLSTRLLEENGIREPLYLTALRYAGVELAPAKKPAHVDSVVIDEADRKKMTDWFWSRPAAEAEKEHEPLLEVRNLTFGYERGRQTLRDVSLTIHKGEMVSIVGKNGAGKSTFSKLVCGFETPDSGEILFQGRDLLQENIRHRAKHIGYVMQNPNQMISKTMIFDEVALSLRNMGKSEEEIREKVEETLKVCGLFPFRNWPVSALSFGQKKRVTIASVLVQDPDLIILDEPTAGQDFHHYTEIMEFLRGLNEKGVTVVMITHDMHLMLEYTPRALVFADGRLIADRSAAAVLCDPQLIRQAALKETSLFTLANQLGISPAEEFVQRFIEEDREVRSHGR